MKRIFQFLVWAALMGGPFLLEAQTTIVDPQTFPSDTTIQDSDETYGRPGGVNKRFTMKYIRKYVRQGFSGVITVDAITGAVAIQNDAVAWNTLSPGVRDSVITGKKKVRLMATKPGASYLADVCVDTVGIDTIYFWNTSVYRLFQAGSGGGQANIQFKDEGSNLGTSGTVTDVNVTGSGATASRSGNAVTINVPGGGGANAYVWTEQFDDDPSLGSNRITGSSSNFTLINAPDTIISVSLNGKRLTGRDFSLSTNTIKIIKTPSRKDTLQVTYLFSSKQTRTTRYDSSQINNVVFYGNSLFYGEGSDIGVNDVVTQTKRLSPSVKFNFVNKGIGGITAGGMQSNISAVLIPSLKSTFGRNIVVVIEGTNQLIGGATGAVSYQSMKSLCLAIKATATNPKVIVVTCPPGANAVPEAQRTIYNDSLRLYYRIFADRLVDLSTKRIGATAAANQIASLYRPDLIHLYPEGYTQMAEAIYPKIMNICGLDSSSTITTPYTNATIKRGGNTADSLDRNITLGNIRNGGLKFNTFNTTRISIDSSGRVIINPVIVNTNAGTNGVYINPSISGNSTGDRVALAVKATVSNSFASGRKVFRLLGENNDTIMDVSSTTAATNTNYWFEFLKSADLRTSRITLLNDVDLATNAYKNAIFFNGSGEGTGNAMTIGRNGNDLRYNTGPGKHSFRAGNIERAYVDVNGLNGDALRLNNSIPLNAPTFTTGGVIFANPGTVNATAMGFASNTLIFNGYNAFEFRIQNVTAFHLNRDTKRVAIGNNTSPTAWMDLPAPTTLEASLRLRSGTAPTSPNEGDVWNDGTNAKYRTGGVTYDLDKVLKGSATLDFASTAASTATDLTITVTGAADGDMVSLGVPNGSQTSAGVFTAWVSATNTVTVRFYNGNIVSAADPASGTFKVSVTK